MNLDEKQRQQVTAWIADGLKLSEIQNRINSEWGLRMTYMEVRFLVDDLKLTPKDPEPPKAAPVLATAPASDADARAASPQPASAPPPAGTTEPAAPQVGVSVTVDQLARPGAMVSGKVTFSDGQKAEWYLDQLGRLGVVPTVKGYKPSQTDVQEFQLALQEEMARMGF